MAAKTQSQESAFPDSELPALLVTVEALARLFETVNDARIFLRVACASLEGKPLAIGQVAAALEMPMSTASRLVFELSQRGLVDFASHPTDRRKKILVTGYAWSNPNGKKSRKKSA